MSSLSSLLQSITLSCKHKGSMNVSFEQHNFESISIEDIIRDLEGFFRSKTQGTISSKQSDKYDGEGESYYFYHNNKYIGGVTIKPRENSTYIDCGTTLDFAVAAVATSHITFTLNFFPKKGIGQGGIRTPRTRNNYAKYLDPDGKKTRYATKNTRR